MQAQDLALSRLSSGCRQAELVAVQRPDELVAGPPCRTTWVTHPRERLLWCAAATSPR